MGNVRCPMCRHVYKKHPSLQVNPRQHRNVVNAEQYPSPTLVRLGELQLYISYDIKYQTSNSRWH